MIRILPLFLALTMLVGSVGVTVNRHFCMGELKSLTLFGEPAACEMHPPAATKPPCPLHGNGQQGASKKKGCCDDKAQFLSWDDDRQMHEQSTLPALPSVDLPQPVSFFPERTPHLRTAALSLFRYYRPPPLVIDVPSHWQVFRL